MFYTIVLLSADALGLTLPNFLFPMIIMREIIWVNVVQKSQIF